MSNSPKMMTLRCEAGNHEWQRASQRGRPPHNCPEHTPTGADNKTGARKAAAEERKARKTEVPAAVMLAAGAGKQDANGIVSDGEDISPQELQARMEREAAIRARTEKALATKAAKKEAAAAAEAERQAEAVKRMTAQVPSLNDRYVQAFESACKDNTREAWNKADTAQYALIRTREAIRKGVTA